MKRSPSSAQFKTFEMISFTTRPVLLFVGRIIFSSLMKEMTDQGIEMLRYTKILILKSLNNYLYM